MASEENTFLNDLRNNLTNVTSGYRDLFNAEDEFMPPLIYSKTELFRSFRDYAFFVMESYSNQDNFDALVPYLAMTYVDRFASTHNIPKVDRQSSSRNTHLFLICCLTIASKMRIDDFKIAGFLSIREAEEPYTGDEASQMELAICQGLQWKLQTITPFSFVDLFINLVHRCSDIHPVIPRRPVHQILINCLTEVELLIYKPSCVAAAAVLIVAHRLYPRKFEQFVLLIYAAHRITLVQNDWLANVSEELARIYNRLSERVPVQAAVAEEAMPRDVALVPIPWDLIGPMDFNLDWTTLVWELWDVEYRVDVKRASQYYSSLFK